MAGRRRGKNVAEVEASAAEANDAELRVKAWTVHQILCREYGCPIRYFHDMDPLSELVSSLLSHRTRNADSGRAFKALRARFATWEAVRDASVAEVEETIAAVTWPEQKAPRIQHVLREITRLRGELSLEFLAELPVPEAHSSPNGSSPRTCTTTTRC